MNTKTLMSSSAIYLALSGISLTFLPDEIISSMGIASNPFLTLSFQILGALYLGFAMLNWMAKGVTIGGIYNKPIAVANFMHFAVGALAFIKIISNIQSHTEIIIALAVFYSIFAILFGYVFRTHPKQSES